jgi:ECF transporter S component (folate family)
MEIFSWFVEALSNNFYFQVVVFTTIFALFSYFSKGKSIATSTNKTYSLTLASLLIALSIVLTRFASAVIPLGGLPSIRIGLGPIPIIIASLVLGPQWGFAVGAVADVVGVTLFPQGSPIFLIFVAQGLYGVLPHYFKLLFRGNSFINFLFTVSLTQLITGFITTIGLAHAFGWPLWSSYFLRLPTQLTLMILYSIIVFLLNKIIQPVVSHRIVTQRR